ncbi:MAG TPA: DUF2878 domain-containing protein [Planctomycetota bacterium]|nr:DUF2878 domain-containing protein [Planctomycetota bacterium]
MKIVANCLLYNLAWFASVWGAKQGSMWLGMLAMGALVALHMTWVPRGERWREVRFLALVCLAGSLVDTGLAHLGVLRYPTSPSPWGVWFVPPWIVALWLGFGTMPRFSLGWLRGWPWPAASVLGAVGGVMAFLGGTGIGSIAPGWGHGTHAVLALEYAILTPLLVFGFARIQSASSQRSGD